MVTWRPGMTLDAIERDVIEASLRFNNNNQTQTAKSLDIAYRTLTDKLARFKKSDQEKEAKLAEWRERHNKNESSKTSGGVHVEPDDESREERTVPVQVGNQVQEVPPTETEPNDTDTSHTEGDEGRTSETARGQSGGGKNRGGKNR